MFKKPLPINVGISFLMFRCIKVFAHMKVLIADDSQVMRSILRRCLSRLSVTDVIESEDGNSAFQKFHESEFDVVISDWNMPNGDGLHLLTQIRQTNKEIPFLMVSNISDRKRVVEAIQSGISDYLMKPFTQEELRDKLNRWVIS